jgi:hypothetical protein
VYLGEDGEIPRPDRSTIAEDESGMSFDESPDSRESGKYQILMDHNYPTKSFKPNKELTEEQKEKVKLMASFKDMKNQDYKSKGLWFRLTVLSR